jgi:stage V sporulation protein D (sporulation-specific penicillin-binding protein)
MNPRKKQNFLDVFFDFFDKYPREYYVVAFFMLFFISIVSHTFVYTVKNHDFYTELAYRQQVWEVEIPVTRGTIYSAPNASMENGTVFSTSVDLNDIAIDPQIEWDKWKLALFLSEILYNEMCYLKDYDDCYSDVLRFKRVLEIEDFVFTKEYIQEIIFKRLVEKISKNKVTSVRVRETLTPEDETTVLTWGITWVYPSSAGLYVNPEELVDSVLFSEKYVELFGWNPEDVQHTVRSRDLRYIPIYQKLSLISSDEVEKHIDDERQALRQWVIDDEESIWGFIILTPHAQRIYPERSVWSQIIWFSDNSWVWHYGLEGYFDNLLRWNPGELVSKKDIKGRNIDPVSFWNDDIDALEGIDIKTTIDRNVQRKVEKILEEWVKKYRANRWTVVVLEPKTGKVLSLANYPSYDANNPWEVYDLKKVNYWEYPEPEFDLLWKSVFVEDFEQGDKFIYDGKEIYLREAKREEYVDYEKTKYIYKNDFGAGVYKNDAISWVYEPWSIMKALTVAIGIDTGEIKAYDFYNDVWSVTIDNFKISNVDKKCLGYNTFTHALAFSCNVWMIRIVQKVWKALMHKYFTDLGFSQTTGITLDGEVSSKIDPYEKWPTSKLLTTSYGLWISVTPLQMASAYATIASGGVYMKPYIVDSITYNDGKQVVYEPEPIRRVLKESTAETVIDMLVYSVDKWVAKNGAVEWYSVAWKTGTAQIAYRGKYEEWVASTNGSFAGFAPAEDPKFVILVKLERPRTSQYGWATSSHIFSEITSELLEYYGIPKKSQK